MWRSNSGRGGGGGGGCGVVEAFLAACLTGVK